MLYLKVDFPLARTKVEFTEKRLVASLNQLTLKAWLVSTSNDFSEFDETTLIDLINVAANFGYTSKSTISDSLNLNLPIPVVEDKSQSKDAIKFTLPKLKFMDVNVHYSKPKIGLPSPTLKETSRSFERVSTNIPNPTLKDLVMLQSKATIDIRYRTHSLSKSSSIALALSSFPLKDLNKTYDYLTCGSQLKPKSTAHLLEQLQYELSLPSKDQSKILSEVEIQIPNDYAIDYFGESYNLGSYKTTYN
ncbi:hypothetical protein [Oligella urethralis]|uniref:Uncharacterized protein n=1 Tax=Oligella urethralis TaxID=90245 RepID=A0A2X1WHC2_9BURK|nr:hypothetical protein [Oligella urethralis]SPY08014.1 Uncharacterised protein [Oligella urethralis]